MKIKMESGERIRIDVPDGRGSGAVAIYDERGRVIADVLLEGGIIMQLHVHGLEVELPEFK